MAPLSTFPLPLRPSGPPAGYDWEERDMEWPLSATTAFNTGIDRRDTFLGQRRCVVCGERGAPVQRCHISRDSDPQLVFHRPK
ncbi:hypothetical protein DFJ58DRAFT_39134 [Suillus subalutaceus]|uniref:uncharacterized protein n=1 Tax=Suillus subalutaceus TaxID=48586 RepID=UPI001B85E807|nr:uncharacterized protein DFJ58DRAFT_39134 [Suillus subalutaceus]KAG1843357.1 hypothetical protein DFJ58DRAFT_39134 [Suillus subalutaceus]